MAGEVCGDSGPSRGGRSARAGGDGPAGGSPACDAGPTHLATPRGRQRRRLRGRARRPASGRRGRRSLRFAHGALRSLGSPLGRRPDAAVRRAPRGRPGPPDPRRLLGALAARGLPRRPARPARVLGLAAHRPRPRPAGLRARRGAAEDYEAIRAGAPGPAPVPLPRPARPHAAARARPAGVHAAHRRFADRASSSARPTRCSTPRSTRAPSTSSTGCAWPLPVAVICELLGVPSEDRSRVPRPLRRRSRAASTPSSCCPTSCEVARDEALTHFAALLPRPVRAAPARTRPTTCSPRSSPRTTGRTA